MDLLANKNRQSGGRDLLAGKAPKRPLTRIDETGNPISNMVNRIGNAGGEIGVGMIKGAGQLLSDTAKMAVNSPFSSPFSIAGFEPSFMKKQKQEAVKSVDRIIDPDILKANGLIQQVSKFATEWAGPGFLGGKASKIAGKMAQIKITPMEKQVVTALKETTLPKLEEYIGQAKKSAIDVREMTPLELAGKEAENALDILRKFRDQAGEAKNIATKKVGNVDVLGVVKQNIANFKRDISSKFGLIIKKDGTLAESSGRKVNIPKSDIKHLQEAMNDLDSIIETTNMYQAGSVLGGYVGKVVKDQSAILRKADDIIDKIQRTIYQNKKAIGKYPINDEVEATVKYHLGKMNREIQEIGGNAYKLSNLSYSQYQSLYFKLNKMVGEGGSKGGSLMKRVFSPSDAGTKKLFSDVKEVTGIDLSNRAVLAKFAMEMVGDTRQTNLLQEVGALAMGGKAGMVKETIEWLIKKMSDQEAKARSLVK